VSHLPKIRFRHQAGRQSGRQAVRQAGRLSLAAQQGMQ
jgi:hypothetical protein